MLEGQAPPCQRGARTHLDLTPPFSPSSRPAVAGPDEDYMIPVVRLPCSGAHPASPSVIPAAASGEAEEEHASHDAEPDGHPREHGCMRRRRRQRAHYSHASTHEHYACGDYLFPAIPLHASFLALCSDTIPRPKAGALEIVPHREHPGCGRPPAAPVAAHDPASAWRIAPPSRLCWRASPRLGGGSHEAASAARTTRPLAAKSADSRGRREWDWQQRRPHSRQTAPG